MSEELCEHIRSIRFSSNHWALTHKHRENVVGELRDGRGGRFCRLCDDEELCAGFSFAGNLLLSHVLRLRLPLSLIRCVYYWLMRCVAGVSFAPWALESMYVQTYTQSTTRSTDGCCHTRFSLSVFCLSYLSFFGRKLLHKLLYIQFLFSKCNWIAEHLFTVQKKKYLYWKLILWQFLEFLALFQNLFSCLYC